ncbi:hypothetical protein CS542_06415 [Pedobacter sp. IW39]|nr:hypothetical protein CS542_06415 [Pedobacter sp. IW39]
MRIRVIRCRFPGIIDKAVPLGHNNSILHNSTDPYFTIFTLVMQLILLDFKLCGKPILKVTSRFRLCLTGTNHLMFQSRYPGADHTHIHKLICLLVSD